MTHLIKLIKLKLIYIISYLCLSLILSCLHAKANRLISVFEVVCTPELAGLSAIAWGCQSPYPRPQRKILQINLQIWFALNNSAGRYPLSGLNPLKKNINTRLNNRNRSWNLFNTFRENHWIFLLKFCAN
jgi:hypothetical protein